MSVYRIIGNIPSIYYIRQNKGDIRRFKAIYNQSQSIIYQYQYQDLHMVHLAYLDHPQSIFSNMR